MDCPICYELVKSDKNCVTTECGHSFHTSCLLKHTAFNGYHCPCCRTRLADEPPTKYEDSDGEEEDDYDEAEPLYTAAVYRDEQYILDGFRWLFQRSNNQSIDYTDPYTEDFERWQYQMEQNNIAYENEIERKTEQVFEVLKKINAISYEDLIKGYLFWSERHCPNSMMYEFHNRKITSILTSVLDRIEDP